MLQQQEQRTQKVSEAESGIVPTMEVSLAETDIISTMDDLRRQLTFLKKALLVGCTTAVGVVIFKLSIQETSKLFYEVLADLLPKPVFYWPQILYPVLGSSVVCVLTLIRGDVIRNGGIDKIAQSIDFDSDYKPTDQLLRTAAAVATLGSGCSLGPEGPSVELGASLSRYFSANDTPRQKRHLFLAGTAAGVSAGFNSPVAGVFFAIECGNRFINKNTVKLETEENTDGPRADIAAIVLAASVAKVVVELGLRESNALSIQGNSFAMQSIFELPLYLGLGVFSGLISTLFTSLLGFFTNLFDSNSISQSDASQAQNLLKSIPVHLRPLLGGAVCGLAALYYPQTVFVGYATLDQLLAGKIHLPLDFLVQLLGLKIFLSSFSLGTGLIGGVFAPSLFFGAVAGTIYHDVVCSFLHAIDAALLSVDVHVNLPDIITLASAPAYASVGAAATLGALFRAPLTATILMLELTENHDIVLPVLMSSGLAGFTSSWSKEVLKSMKK